MLPNRSAPRCTSNWLYRRLSRRQRRRWGRSAATPSRQRACVRVPVCVRVRACGEGPLPQPRSRGCVRGKPAAPPLRFCLSALRAVRVFFAGAPRGLRFRACRDTWQRAQRGRRRPRLPNTTGLKMSKNLPEPACTSRCSLSLTVGSSGGPHGLWGRHPTGWLHVRLCGSGRVVGVGVVVRGDGDGGSSSSRGALRRRRSQPSPTACSS